MAKSSAQRSGTGSSDGYATRAMPTWMRLRAHRVHGGHVTNALHPASGTPMRAACMIAFSSAWQISGYFFARSSSRSSSATPRGNPLYPVLRISRSGPTITQPILDEGSLLHLDIWRASSMNLVSQQDVACPASRVQTPHRPVLGLRYYSGEARPRSVPGRRRAPNQRWRRG